MKLQVFIEVHVDESLLFGSRNANRGSADDGAMEKKQQNVTGILQYLVSCVVP